MHKISGSILTYLPASGRSRISILEEKDIMRDDLKEIKIDL